MKDFHLKYKKHYVKIIFAILILIIFLKLAKIKDFSFIINSLSNHLFWLSCTLLIFAQIIKAVRFQLLISEYNIKIPFIKNLLIHFIVPIVGLLTPSKLGEVTKVILINKEKKKVGFCFILEKLIDLEILLILAVIGIYRFTISINSIFLVIPIVIVAIIALINFDRIFNFLFRRFIKTKLEKKWFITNLGLFLKPKHITILVLGVLVWIFTIYAAYNLSLITGIEFKEIKYFDFCSVYASAILVGIISGLPGGIGSRETAISLLFFQIFKIDIKIGGIFSILVLFTTYITFSVVGIISYFIFNSIYQPSRFKLF